MKSKWVKFLIEIGWILLAAFIFCVFLIVMQISAPKPYDKPILDRMYYVTCNDGYQGVIEVYEIAKGTYKWVDQETSLPIELGTCTKITVFERE